mmetsp:Transcript_26263/g.73339  ORF Transcript_26263/g.73339 Transcript_26263/m.73339 type:complete len:85 (-) Transcript_26263:116-370(-)
MTGAATTISVRCATRQYESSQPKCAMSQFLGLVQNHVKNRGHGGGAVVVALLATLPSLLPRRCTIVTNDPLTNELHDDDDDDGD